MAVTRMTMIPPVPTAYAWEATSESVAERYGLSVAEIARFDLNTVPEPPEVAWRILAGRDFAAGLSEYPPSDYRTLVEAASAVYGVGRDEILVGAGADEVLEIICKALLEPGTGAIIAPPTYSMYRVLSEQRRARVIAVPRFGRDAGFGLDVAALRTAARDASLMWLCNPNNPTATADSIPVLEELLDGLDRDARAECTIPIPVVIDEAYVEFSGTSAVGLRARYPRLIVVRTASKAYGLAGLRVGFALARPELLGVLEPYRPPGSVSVVSISVVEAALRDGASLAERVAGTLAERGRLAAALAAVGWIPEPSVTNFLLVPFGSPERSAEAAEGLLRRGLVPRTFPPGHPLAGALRFTVRSAKDDDRLIAAAAEITGDLDTLRSSARQSLSDAAEVQA